MSKKAAPSTGMLGQKIKTLAATPGGKKGERKLKHGTVNSPYARSLAPGGAEQERAGRGGREKCVALHNFEGLDLYRIASIAPRQDYSEMQSRDLLQYGVAAVKIAQLGERFSRPVFLELDKRFKAGKKSKHYFLGLKSIDAMCKLIGISRKHFYNVIEDNRSGRKRLSPQERAAKDAAKEEARIKREQAKSDREAKRRAERERLRREAEELKTARENNRNLQRSLDKKDDDMARAKQADADEAMSKAATAATQKEKRSAGYSPELLLNRSALNEGTAGLAYQHEKEPVTDRPVTHKEPINDESRHENAVRELEDLGHFGITSWDEWDIEYALEVREIDTTAENVAAIRRHPRMSEITELMKATGWDVIWTIIDELSLGHKATSAIQSKHSARG